MDCSSCSEALAAWGLPETLLDGVDPDARPLLWGQLRAVLEAAGTALPDRCFAAQRERLAPHPPPGASTGGADARAKREAAPWAAERLRAKPDATGGRAACSAAVSGGAWGGVGHTRREPLPFVYQHYARPRFQQCHLRGLDLAGWHKKLRLALWMAAEALEARYALPNADDYLTLLAEQCAWIGQLYADLKRRAGPVFAPVIFQGEVRLLQYRASAAVTDLLFAA